MQDHEEFVAKHLSQFGRTTVSNQWCKLQSWEKIHVLSWKGFDWKFDWNTLSLNQDMPLCHLWINPYMLKVVQCGRGTPDRCKLFTCTHFMQDQYLLQDQWFRMLGLGVDRQQKLRSWDLHISGSLSGWIFMVCIFNQQCPQETSQQCRDWSNGIQGRAVRPCWLRLLLSVILVWNFASYVKFHSWISINGTFFVWPSWTLWTDDVASWVCKSWTHALSWGDHDHWSNSISCCECAACLLICRVAAVYPRLDSAIPGWLYCK